MTDAPAEKRKFWLDFDLKKILPWNLETALALIILALAILTRLYGLGDRVLSHDEMNHYDPGYTLSQGGGFIFSPMTHGPVQMHLIALSFILFGDSDFTGRLPAATASILTVAIGLFLFRRYLGRTGAIVAGFLLLISPYMLYYGRYQRNEATIVVWLMLSMYAILRYLERGEKGSLILFTAATALHFTDKTTSYMYAAAQMVFLVVYFFSRMARRPGVVRSALVYSLGFFAGAAVLLGLAVKLLLDAVEHDLFSLLPGLSVGLLGLAAGVAGIVLLLQAVGSESLRRERSLDLILLLGALVVPLSGAVVMRLFGLDPQSGVGAGVAAWVWLLLPVMTIFSLAIYWTFAENQARLIQPIVLFLLGLGALLIPPLSEPSFFIVYYLIAVAVSIGMLWNPKWWTILGSLFFVIYLLFFTTFLTNINGMADGVFKFLGYWMEQQSVSRGSQPWFYFLLVQIPIYEYLPFIGAILALVITAARRLWVAAPGRPFDRPEGKTEAPPEEETGEPVEQPVPTLALLLFWSLFGLVIFTYAGEKMPQATMLIAQPMILATAWMIGYLVEAGRGPVARSVRGWVFAAFALMAGLTARTAYTAAYLTYDYPVEYLAYAHGAPGLKNALQEIERLSYLTTGGTDVVVAYDNCVRYSYGWYLRHYKNRIDYDVSPTSDIRRAAIVLTESGGSCAPTKDRVDAILKDDYVGFEQTRMWWHNQDYWDLKWDFINAEYLSEMNAQQIENPPPMGIGDYLRLVAAHFTPWFTDPAVRSGVLQIWLNRDFVPYGQAIGQGGYTLQDWSLTDRFYVYFRKDLLDFVSGQSEGYTAEIPEVDPYALAQITMDPDQVLGGEGSGPGQFIAPRGIAMAADGSFYAADSLNHRIQHFDAAGNFLQAWGTQASVDSGDAPGGTFNEPWGIAVGPDGSVYVADTWNHRVQKFTADGVFVTMWGERLSSDGTGIAFYGPRAVAVDSQGRVLVTDTGNKRIVVFDSDGNYLSQIGSAGVGLGDLDEPVGIALSADGRLFVADTWNRRVQIFTPDPDGTFFPESAFDVSAWYGTLPDFKPYLALDAGGHVYITDPSTCRILEFNERGLILTLWGSCGESETALNSPTGLALDTSGGIWVSDSRNNRLLHFHSPN